MLKFRDYFHVPIFDSSHKKYGKDYSDSLSDTQHVNDRAVTKF